MSIKNKHPKRIIKIIIILCALFSISFLYIKINPFFGGNPDIVSKKRIIHSENYDGTRFKNLLPTQTIEKGNIMRILTVAKSQLFPSPTKNPKGKIKSEKLEVKAIHNGDFVWLGHSTILFKTNDKFIITDPIFYNAAPVPFIEKPFEVTNKVLTKDLPYIDIVLISHDHYDHLDYHTIKEIASKVGLFYVPLGIKGHLQRWGVPDKKIIEFDWYDEIKLEDMKFVFTPSRHSSGRSINDKCKTLWGSWVIISPDIKIYFSGDGGYSNEFTKIGEMFNGFDIAFMECGAYDKLWKNVHMFPEETAQAIIDIHAKIAVPIHWGKFDLSTHKWNESPVRLLKSMNKYNNEQKKENKIIITTPKINEIINLNHLPQNTWWNNKE